MSRPVSIVLATLNGAPFLRSQLRSICAQTYENWQIILSDDGSTDDTLNIARLELRAEKLRILQGTQQGLAQNFWHGLMQVPDGNAAAFCDQDDVWRKDKLKRAMDHLTGFEGPTLYSADRYIADVHLNVRRIQRRSAHKGFARTFFQNPIAGHTCVLSPDAVQMLKRAPPKSDVPFHDWWAALVLSRHGARFIHDPTPVLYYRQHDANVIGASGRRVKAIFNGTYFRWLRANQNALRICLAPRTQLSLGRKNKR